MRVFHSTILELQRTSTIYLIQNTKENTEMGNGYFKGDAKKQ